MAQCGARGEGDGEEAAECHEQAGMAVGEPQPGHRGRAERSGQEGEQDPARTDPGRRQGLAPRARLGGARHARVQFLGEREHVPVAEPRGGPVGETVCLQPRRDLQRIHGPFAQLPVPVQQGLHRVTGPTAGPEGPLPLGPDVRPRLRYDARAGG
ncbi:hypothetical protein, partial [Streptomyces tricolor]|uniref:hypothetical protein n=1 Tax=Streptomyces tricolor TaxID=68277 RepID=UPI0039E1E03A